MKVVLDTNIWVSALLLPKSLAGKVTAAWKQAKVEIVTSPSILEEIHKVLAYPKIRKRIGWDDERIEQYVSLLKFMTHYSTNADISVKVRRDPKDDHVLATLINSEADYLVTGDKDLLDLKMEHPIITLPEFIKLID